MSLSITIENKAYPELLRRIKNPPKKLYYKGNINLLKDNKIAVIGSRKITDYGKFVEKKFVIDLALKDIAIVSGMALRSR